MSVVRTVRNASTGLRPTRIIAAFLLLCSMGKAAEDTVVTLGMGTLRSTAASIALPVYPASSIAAKHEGAAVAQVLLSPSGKVLKVTILEAPDPEIAKAVEDAVGRWLFHPFQAPGDVKAIAGRLLFYFRLVNGRPKVIDALGEGRRVQPH